MTVHLVGAGPGDPELLTVRAARLLAQADVVVHDALVGTGVLALAAPDAELIDVGKRPGRPVPQETITALLVQLGQAHRCVVRLKGGDPFVFGRGGEEMVGLVGAGVSVEVVPGISSSFAAAALAGVPVTHRGLSASVTVVTGHRQPGGTEPAWGALAQAGGTIVVMMGVARRAYIAGALMEGGLAAGTPVLAVTSASTDDERRWCGRLDQLASAPVDSPATIVIGEVVAVSPILAAADLVAARAVSSGAAPSPTAARSAGSS